MSTAKVVKMYGSGKELLVRAIESGLVAPDVRREIEFLVRRNHELTIENEFLRIRLLESRGALRGITRIHIGAYARYLENQRRRRSNRFPKFVAITSLILIGVFVGTLVTLLVS